MNRGVVVAYAGVHQAFEIARAAEGAGVLDKFFCSVANSPNKWGGIIGRILGRESLVSRRCSGLGPDKVAEIPIPLIAQKCVGKVPYFNSRFSWQAANAWFDSIVARRLAATRSRVFIGTETCARDCFRVAKSCGMKRVLDCPQAHPAFLKHLLKHASADLGISEPPPFDQPWLAERKAEEFASADFLLVISDIQRVSFEHAGIPAERLIQIPLWADPDLWFPEAVPKERTEFLDALFVGSLDLRKGVPYLVRALKLCGPQVRLKVVSSNSKEALRLVSTAGGRIDYVGALNKEQLRRAYSNSDVLVLPSLIDTFGFVAMEAMACGCPVIVTQNCGVPVPSQAWRVPIMSAQAIAERLERYRIDRDLLASDARLAKSFAAGYTPERYRKALGEFLLKLLRN